MKISHFNEAVAVAALIGVTWAGPQLFAVAVPEPSLAQTSSEPVILGQDTETAEFTVPAGWDIKPRKTDSAILLTKDDIAIDIRINDGGYNDDNSLDRTLLNLNREGTAAAWDGGEFSTPALLHKGDQQLELVARKCSVIVPATVDSASFVGDCVIAAGQGLSVSIVVTYPETDGENTAEAESDKQTDEINPVEILESAVIHRDGDSGINPPSVSEGEEK